MLKSRPSIVTVLGHVDHGKTTLLDYIRRTTIASHEVGGITQSIGASQITTKEGSKITFIDTPGHSAFSSMRSRGAKVCDIAVLVVDSTGGVKPQTKESLEFINEMKIPFIVAVTKIDLPSSSVDSVYSQLEKEGVTFEGRGGNTPLVPLSGKTGKGVEELLEVISLVAEVNKIEGDSTEELEAIVIETTKDNKGILVSVVVRKGTLKVGEELSTEGISARLRGIFNVDGKSVEEARPGDVVQILGFDEFPPVGSKVKLVQKDLSDAEIIINKVKRPEIQPGEIPIVIKAKNSGSLEAIIENIPQGVTVVSSGVGNVNESDVFLAKIRPNTHIIAFESDVSASVIKLAETEGIKIEKFDLVYDLIESLVVLKQQDKQKIQGIADILAVFSFDRFKVAGCKITQGRITKDDILVLKREAKELGKVKILSMKRQKEVIREANIGEELGIIFEPQLDFKVKDVLVSVRK